MNTSSNPDKLYIILGKDEGNPLYFLELIKHLGYFYEKISFDYLNEKFDGIKILILYGPLKITDKQEKILKKFVKEGGSLIAIGNIEGIEDILGCKVRPLGEFPFPIGGTLNNSVGEGYLTLKNGELDSRLTMNFKKDYFPLHGFSCTPVQPEKAEVWAEYEPLSQLKQQYPAITQHKTSKGMVIYFAPDVCLTIRHIQECLYVDKDGMPPADGMAPIDDGILKCEDGLVLDWIRDRKTISNQKVSAFMIPVVDVWMELFNKCIEIVADFTSANIQKVQYWPDNADFIMFISHDTDGNDEKLAEGFLEYVNTLQIKTTWCLIQPGYSPELCQKISNCGHELAFHFDAQTDGKLPDIFSFDVLKDQVEEIKEKTKITNFYSNKNHYTRWEGRIDFFLWLEKLGFKVDQSKGPSKCGTMGFPFGTCFPWFPMNNTGKLINCLEISFQSQDIGLQGPRDTGKALVDAVREFHGVSHFIFHPAHFNKKEVREEFRNIVNYGKSIGAKFMRSIDIGEWIFKRREFIESNKRTLLQGAVIMIRNPTTKCWEKG